MKSLLRLHVILIAALASLWLAAAAAAQTSLVYTDGDLFIGFRSSTATNDYLVDIGQYTKFTGHSVGYHLTLGTWSTDLTTVFGSTWPTDINVQWGAAGTHDFDGGTEIANLYASKAEPSIGTFAQPWERNSQDSQDGTSSAIETLAYGGFYGNTSTVDNPTGYIQPAAGTNPSWASNMPGGVNTSSFMTWVPTVEAPITAGSGTGIVNTRLDLFQMLPDNTGTNPPGTYVGSFSIDSSGTVSFDVFNTSSTPTPTPTATPTPSGSPTATPTPTASATATITPTPTPSGSPTPTPSPSPTPPLNSVLANISTRLDVETGDNILIGGFEITGTGPKQVVLRAIGPSLPLPGVLADPTLSLYDKTGTLIATNDDWMTNTNMQAIIDSTLAPTNPKESALLIALQPNPYTAEVKGSGGTTGIGLIEIYDLDSTGTSKLANISTRGFVQTGTNVMIAGTIIIGDGGAEVLVRALGPSLPLANALSDPTLEIYDSSGQLMFSNDNWQDTQEAAIEATGLAPTNDKESAILATLASGAYTAIVQGVDGTTGNALVEIYRLSE